MTIDQQHNLLIDKFSILSDWQEKYNYLISLGKDLPDLDNSHKTNQFIIKGCQSRVWLIPELRNGKLYFEVFSDAIIPKGIAALIKRAYSGYTPEEIVKKDHLFIEQIGLNEFLSPTRANGLLAMIKQIKFYAIGYLTKISSENEK